MADSNTTLAISPYRKGGPPLKMEMLPLYRAEERIREIGYASKHQAKELFSTFLHGYIYAAKLHAMVKLHVARATTEARKRRSILTLDHMPEMAKAKGLATSRSPTGAEDIREAFLYRDEEYLAIEEGRAALEAAETLLFGKMMALRDASDACKAMLSPEEVPRMSNAETLPSPHGTDEVRDPMGASDPPPVSDIDGFGRPSH